MENKECITEFFCIKCYLLYFLHKEFCYTLYIVKKIAFINQNTRYDVSSFFVYRFLAVFVLL